MSCEEKVKIAYCCKRCGHKKKIKVCVPIILVAASATRVANQSYGTSATNVLYDNIRFDKKCTQCEKFEYACNSCGSSGCRGCNSCYNNCYNGYRSKYGGCGGCSSNYECYAIYNPSTGEATIPRGGEGCYNISATVVVEGAATTTVELRRNGMILDTRTIGDDVGCNSAGLTAWTTLCDCDKIYVRIVDSANSALITPNGNNVNFNLSRIC